ncbi:hypothetical protein [Prochlorococcus marinus]|uniref:hypothetical protein n=1 Tax=Prochlorococcus marinus TaxID=1219 RepID=UPI00214B32F9|nr:hypothetical protein [Prochlorococcus marinus]
MIKNNRSSRTNFNYLRILLPFSYNRYILLFLSGLILLPIQQANSEELFLKCTGKFEINRGPLIKPDWETSYLTINLVGLKSTINNKGLKKEGRTLIRRNSYTITLRDKSNRIKTKYKIHGTLGTYIVESPIRNRTLIGTCEKSRG